MVTMRVIWTKYAYGSLLDIYKYYMQNVSIHVANKIKDQLLYSTKQLEKYPLSGPIENLLMELNQEHRFIIRGNYKIIYKILNSNIYITDVFDTRQDPRELKFRNR